MAKYHLFFNISETKYVTKKLTTVVKVTFYQ